MWDFKEKKKEILDFLTLEFTTSNETFLGAALGTGKLKRNRILENLENSKYKFKKLKKKRQKKKGGKFQKKWKKIEGKMRKNEEISEKKLQKWSQKILKNS